MDFLALGDDDFFGGFDERHSVFAAQLFRCRDDFLRVDFLGVHELGRSATACSSVAVIIPVDFPWHLSLSLLVAPDPVFRSKVGALFYQLLLMMMMLGSGVLLKFRGLIPASPSGSIPTMPKRKGLPKDHDFAVNARSVLEQVIGERLDGTPLEPVKPTNPKLTERARKGGVVGGRARALKLSAERRSEIARKAANARWKE